MAHVEKFKRDAVAAMMHHYTRDNDRTLGRSNIDPARTRGSGPRGAPSAKTPS